MPAPNVAYLYDLEGAFEDCLANYFANTNQGGQTFLQVITPRTNITVAEFLKTPRLQVRIGVTGPVQAGSGLQQGQYTLANVSQNYWSAYSLTAEFTVCTTRSNSSQQHGTLRGAVRAGMLPASAIMNTNSLPYWEVWEVTPLTSTQGIDPDNDEINTQMMYQIDVYIPPSSFPNS